MANQDIFSEMYLAKLPRGLILTFNEAVMRRSLERNFKRAKDAKAGKEPVAVLRPWLGQHAGFKISRDAIKAFSPVFGRPVRSLVTPRGRFLEPRRQRACVRVG